MGSPMSRRITAFALAASIALIATQAHADRECFENSCRLPGVSEAPPPAAAKVESSEAAPDRSVHELAADAMSRPLSKTADNIAKHAAPSPRLAPRYPKPPKT